MGVLARELVLREGAIPSHLAQRLNGEAFWDISPEGFVLRTPEGIRFYYQPGVGVTFERGAGISDQSVNLYLSGSVYGAVAWMNGFVPLHASAVCYDGRIYAFTGDSEAGKSTLAAGLASEHMPLYADDVLILDFSEPEFVRCLPGHKFLKLWDDAFGLVEAERNAQVSPAMEKYFARPPHISKAGPLPLAAIFRLEFGEELRLEPLTGATCFASLSNAFYRPHFAAKARASGVDIFGFQARLANEIDVSLFHRPDDRAMFRAGLDLIEEAITGAA